MRINTISLKTLILAMAFINQVYAQKEGVAPKQFAHSFKEYSAKYTNNQLAPILKPAIEIYVSVKGNDKNSGTKKSPFKTIEAARNSIRTLKSTKGLPNGGVQVILLDGTYHIDETINFNKEDSGTNKAPIVYKGVTSSGVVLSGGLSIDTNEFNVVDDKELIERLNPKAKGKVISLDLSNNRSIANYFQGFGDYGQISMDGYMLQLAQWPNRGYNQIGEIIESGPTTRWLKPGEEPMPFSRENPTGGQFVFKEALSPLVQKEFERTADMQAQGYFHNDWYFQDEPIGAIIENSIQLLHHTRYGILDKINSLPRRVRLFNVLAELDEPGEWYFDKIEKRLYVWPIDGFKRGKSTLTVIGRQLEEGDNRGGELLKLENTSYLTFRDLIFENTDDLAVNINGGEYNLLASCIFRNGDRSGVRINNGKYNGISGCDFYDLYNAFSITGGDFKTLENSYNFATNNIIRNCRLRGYGVIGLSGVGLYFANNLLHSMNGAVSYNTVNLLMEYNEFYNIGYEMGDFNVAYCGAQWYTMNNVVRYNFVHHLFEPGGHPVMAFRNDDNGQGMKVYGNVFYRSGRGSVQFDGALNDFQNNISLDVPVMWWTLKKKSTREAIDAQWGELSKFGKELPSGDKGDYLYITEKLIGEKGWEKSPWIDTFPEMKLTMETNPFSQTYCNVNLNYAYKVREEFHIHGGSGTVEGMESKAVGEFDDLPKEGEFRLPKAISLNDFKDIKSLDFNFNKNFKPMDGFKTIPFDNIGLIDNDFRVTPFNTKENRKSIYKRFENEVSGRYNPEVVNARYPIPGYLNR
ncbi:right-handed parallel beta-helix repeat-containing protein [Mariniflexile sp. AS56]|uniref:right-handed parallel beta-helix repeat-containing protein n=1 Tax=Mariniflexile sp. AS56 TaxID=3063957 RepID=UPI0026F01234|nr:right-handed parallel beta-helix repeat-containing protein [Mariniflexile sp. AS56]MDO7172494.1 right-handed parallel beta-helix repeat-containing protein [Mariniflexile sp. AS56]